MSIAIRKVRVNGRELAIRLEPNGAGWYVDTGNGPRYASVLEVEPGVFSVILDGKSFDVRTAASTVVVEDPREHRPSGRGVGLQGPQSLSAPMPGKVVRRLVSEGDAVEQGQGILVIEAMKMQNEMKSPKAGVVVSLPAEEGAAVAAGQLLAVVE